MLTAPSIAAGVSSDKASSFGVSAAGSMSSNFGVPTTTHAPGVSVDQEPAATEEESVVPAAGGDRHSIHRSVRWGEATGGNWDAKRGSELEGDTLDKKEVYSKIKQGGMSAEELDSWRTENNVKMTGKAQEFLSNKLGRQITQAKAEKPAETPVSQEPQTGTGASDPAEGGVTDTQEMQVKGGGTGGKSTRNPYRYKAGHYFHKPDDEGNAAFADNIADQAIARADARVTPFLTELQKRIDQKPLYYKARSDVQTGDYLGDIWNFDVGDFKMPKPLDAVEKPDIAGISNDYMDRIDSIKPKL